MYAQDAFVQVRYRELTDLYKWLFKMNVSHLMGNVHFFIPEVFNNKDKTA